MASKSQKKHRMPSAVRGQEREKGALTSWFRAFVATETFFWNLSRMFAAAATAESGRGSSAGEAAAAEAAGAAGEGRLRLSAKGGGSMGRNCCCRMR